MTMFPGSACISPQARGIVLILGSDSSPLGSVLNPLVGAVVASNSVVIKPSEKFPKSYQALRYLISEHLDLRFYYCCDMGQFSRQELVSLPFDLLHFTGKEDQAKEVSKWASSNLIPLVLEIERPSLYIVDSSASIKKAAKK